MTGCSRLSIDLDKLESHLESKQQRQQQLQEPMIQNLHDLVKSFQGTADRLTSGVEANLEALMQKHLREATDRYVVFVCHARFFSPAVT